MLMGSLAVAEAVVHFRSARCLTVLSAGMVLRKVKPQAQRRVAIAALLCTIAVAVRASRLRPTA